MNSEPVAVPAPPAAGAPRSWPGGTAQPSPARFFAVAATIALLVVGLAVLSIMLERQRARERAVVATQNLVLLLDQHVSDTLDKVDIVVRAALYGFQERAARGAVDHDQVDAFLLRAQQLAPDIDSLRVLDRNGIVRYGTGMVPGVAVNLSDRDFFIRARDDDAAGLIMYGPVFARIAQKWVIVLARRVLDREGRFAGVVYANVATTRFETMLSGVSLGRSGAATIRTVDLALVHRAPSTAGKVGSKEVSQGLRDALAARPEAGEFTAATALDGIERTNGYRRLRNYPLYVLVGLATDEYLASWQPALVFQATLAALAVLVTAAAAFLVYRGQQRLAVDIAERERVSRELEQVVQEDRRLKVELVQRAHDAEAANRAKGAFLANMSHEIRTPLNYLLGNAFLMRREPLTPAQTERLAGMETAGRRLLALLNDVLELARIDAGRLDIARLPFELDDLRRDIQEVFAGRMAGKGLDFRIDFAGLPPRALGDPDRLLQALSNLLENALKFTERGHIELRGRLQSMTAQECVLRFEVQDSGIGIAPQEQARLFQPFEQVDMSMTRRFGGTGLGLALTRRIARLMGGDAGFTSEPDRGSTFWLTVRLGVPVPEPGDLRTAAPPLDAPPADDAQAAGDKEGGERGAALRQALLGARVLVVEDDPFGRRLLQELLAYSGMEPVFAVDGREAVTLVESHEFDLVLMDVQMPVMDGLEATRRIRALPQGRELPIIGLTAHAFAEDRASCLQAGMSDFITKPVAPYTLFTAMARWRRGGAPQAPGR